VTGGEDPEAISVFFWHRENEGEDWERIFHERIRIIHLRGQVAVDPSTIKISAFRSLGFE
jgi:hypothetical protein